MTATTTTTAADFAPGIKMAKATRAKAEKLATLLRAEYPALVLVAQEDEEQEGKLAGFAINVESEDGDTIWEGPKVPEIADVLEAAEAAGVNPEGEPEEDDEPKLSGSVVPEHYRQAYREISSNGQTCGDWLAEWLVAQTHNGQGFNVEDFTAILSNNDLDMTKGWALLPLSGQKGWIGRYRMNGRQVLEKVVALRGWIKDLQGAQEDVPAEALKILREKHAKWLAKEDKKAKAALAI